LTDEPTEEHEEYEELPNPPAGQIPAHSTQLYMEVCTADAYTNRMLAYAGILRTVDDLVDDAVRVEGLRLLRALGDTLAGDRGKLLEVLKR
jgi:hypothetical protein